MRNSYLEKILSDKIGSRFFVFENLQDWQDIKDALGVTEIEEQIARIERFYSLDKLEKDVESAREELNEYRLRNPGYKKQDEENRMKLAKLTSAKERLEFTTKKIIEEQGEKYTGLKRKHEELTGGRSELLHIGFSLYGTDKKHDVYKKSLFLYSPSIEAFHSELDQLGFHHFNLIITHRTKSDTSQAGFVPNEYVGEFMEIIAPKHDEIPTFRK